MSVYNSKEDLIENFSDMFEFGTFEELLDEIKGIYEVIEIKGDCELEFLVEIEY
jgi:hypothetical protein